MSDPPPPPDEAKPDALDAASLEGGAAVDEGPSTAQLIGRTLLGLVAFVLVVAMLAALFRAPLERLGGFFVERFGLWGMALGTFLADAFSVPVPPQFYLFTAVTAGGPQLEAVVTICTASVVAGITGYQLARRLGDTPWMMPIVVRSRRRIDPLFKRHGFWAVGIASFTPFPYSMLCYVAGLYRMPARLFAVLLLLRIPRVVLYYALIRAGWR